MPSKRSWEARDTTLREALKKETGLFVERWSSTEVLAAAQATQARFDDSATSYEAFQIPHP